MSLLLSLLLLLTGAISFVPNQDYYVTASSCYLYEDASFDSAKVQVSEEDVVLTHGQIVVFQSEEGNFCLVTIKNSETTGYVYKYYLTENNSVSYYPVYNASIREDCLVYDVNYSQTEITLKKGQRVYIYDGFDNKKEYTAVQFVLEDGTLYNGYVETSKVKPDGVNRAVIIAVPLIAAIVTIVLSIVFIQKKRKKKKK